MKIPILMYHRIGERRRDSIVPDQYVSESLLDRQLAALKRKGFRSISLTEMAKRFASGGEGEEKLMVITFDDGYASFAERAVPVLRRHGMKATVFMVANTIGKTNAWDEAKGDVTERIMTVDQVAEVANLGHDIGAHTLNHPELDKCDDNRAAEEIVTCRKRLQDELSLPIDWFSYPYGIHTPRDEELARQAGYSGACGTAKQVNTPSTDPFAYGRINVRATSSPLYLMYKIRKAMKKNG